MKWTVQIELFGHKFNVPVEAFDEEEAKEVAMIGPRNPSRLLGCSQAGKRRSHRQRMNSMP